MGQIRSKISKEGFPSGVRKRSQDIMNVKITYKHLSSTDGIDQVTRKKSEKLKKYFKGKLNLDWNFAVEKHAHVAHCHLTGDHIEFFAEATTENLYAAIDEVIHHLERQVRRNKEQVRNHKGQSKVPVPRAA